LKRVRISQLMLFVALVAVLIYAIDYGRVFIYHLGYREPGYPFSLTAMERFHFRPPSPPTIFVKVRYGNITILPHDDRSDDDRAVTVDVIKSVVSRMRQDSGAIDGALITKRYDAANNSIHIEAKLGPTVAPASVDRATGWARYNADVTLHVPDGCKFALRTEEGDISIGLGYDTARRPVVRPIRAGSIEATTFGSVWKTITINIKNDECIVDVVSKNGPVKVTVVK